MSLDKAMRMLKFDKRLTEWNINNGKLSKEELNQHLEALPDNGGNVDLLNLDSVDDDGEDKFHH